MKYVGLLVQHYAEGYYKGAPSVGICLGYADGCVAAGIQIQADDAACGGETRMRGWVIVSTEDDLPPSSSIVVAIRFTSSCCATSPALSLCIHFLANTFLIITLAKNDATAAVLSSDIRNVSPLLLVLLLYFYVVVRARLSFKSAEEQLALRSKMQYLRH